MSSPSESFIARWSQAGASERANAQQFLIKLADLLEVPRPSNSHSDGYSFEFPVKIPRGDGTFTEGRMDLYRRAAFVLEAKQFAGQKEEPTSLAIIAEDAGIFKTKKSSSPVRGTGAWDDAMLKARGQAERYARSLPAGEPNPPFLLVVDVGHSIEVFADFTQAGKSYLPFPDPRSFLIRLADLADEAIRERLRRIWPDPLSLDPAKVSAAVIGQTGDEGIDGIIKEDRLGLDTIYIQAKKWEATVGRPEIQKFAGALQGFRAKKGIFLTTSDFSREAQDFAGKIDSKIVLIDGETLWNLMIDHGLGVTTIASYEVKRLDNDYFDEENG